MVRFAVLAIALAVSAHALAADATASRTVDLRDAGALEKLRQSNPAHFEKIQQVLAGLLEEPRRAEGDWLQATFAARDVDLSRYLFRTSNPPKQILRFTLDDVRYIMYLARHDLTASPMPADAD